ncbi:MAG TPA: type II secretion system F family protein [Vicinamibacterales bacterium]|jgi:tight adherence protein B|nr:type II secretion system F family protein [Vicinamibacterales bacterium]
MLLAIGVFLIVTGIAMGVGWAISAIPGNLAQKRLEKRLREVGSVSSTTTGETASVVRQDEQGPLPAVQKLLGKTGAGAGLSRLIDQSGVRATTGGILLVSASLAVLGMFGVLMFSPVGAAAPIGLLLGALPILFLLQRRSARIKKFEEQFPEALDLLARALRAGHAFQTSLGMVADEVAEPVGPEFKKTFDQQNFGLPLKECLFELADRMPLLDVRFFATAVTIQRETGGNLAEILDNLAYVVRERFKILRQVRVHTAHGRFTGYVLLALPAVLGIILSYLSPDHMNTLFTEPMGKQMLLGAGVMQTVGYFWIKQVIKIEV